MTDKFCKDCKFFIPEKFVDLSGCSGSKWRSLVTGEKKVEIAMLMRLPTAECGVEGLLFQPRHQIDITAKPTFNQRLLRFFGLEA